MKINPGHPIPQAAPGTTAKSGTESLPGRFAQVLAQAAGAACRVPPTAAATSPPPVARPAMVGTETLTYERTEQVLDAMAHYQRVLGDRGATLRAVAPCVRRMQAAVGELEPLLANRPADDPLRVVAGQALILASKEIARFDSGHYIDD